MMVVQLGSMAIKGIFKAGSLLSGLGNTSSKLKDVQQRSKSTTTEMKRMTKGAKMLSGALAAIGVAGFTALLMTTPQLAGALAKIKNEMQRIAWSIGKHLKPALDSVATILRGIRTGDWSTVIQGVKELAGSILTIADKIVTVTIDTVFGEGTAEQTKTDFKKWIASLEKAWEDRDLPKLIEVGIWEPIAWAGEKLGDFQRSMMADLEGEKGAAKGARARGAIQALIEFGESIGDFQRSGFSESRQVGGMIGHTGMYKMHAGETVTMKGSGGIDNSGKTDITLDFSGANITLSGGIQLDQFADVISMKIAERQNSLTY